MDHLAMGVGELGDERAGRALLQPAFLIKKSKDTVAPPSNELENWPVVLIRDVLPGDALSLILFLLLMEHVRIELLLQHLVGKVDAPADWKGTGSAAV